MCILVPIDTFKYLTRRQCKESCCHGPGIYKFHLYLYLYSAQYTVQFNSQVTDIPLTERQRLKDDHLSTSLRFFNLPLGIGPNDRGPPF